MRFSMSLLRVVQATLVIVSLHSMRIYNVMSFTVVSWFGYCAFLRWAAFLLSSFCKQSKWDL